MIALNTLNAHFYAQLKKIHIIADKEEVTASHQRLEELKLDIREKIRNLANNIDYLYQSLDAKISVVVGQLRKLPNCDNSPIKRRLEELEATKRDNEESIAKLKQENQLLRSQNEDLRSRNI